MASIFLPDELSNSHDYHGQPLIVPGTAGLYKIISFPFQFISLSLWMNPLKKIKSVLYVIFSIPGNCTFTLREQSE
jgi:hypothetical protein